MLRDLVYNYRNICTVIGVDREHITVISQHYGKSTHIRDLIRPIPLSEEIINQLGWVEVKEGDEGFDAKKKSVVKKQYHNPDYITTLNIIHGENSGLWYILGGEFHMRYVHDLQHVLRHRVTDDIGYDTEKGFYLIDGYIERLHADDND